MRRFVVGDIHGNLLGFKQALERACFNYEEDMLISLGDLVDGHSQSKEVLDELLKIKHKVLVQGNHDEWFKEFALQTVENTAKGLWINQGGKATVTSYGYEVLPNIELGEYYQSSLGSYLLKGGNIPEEHKELLASQVSHFIMDNILFIHGGFNRHFLLSEQESKLFCWDRDLWAQALSWESMGSHEGYKPPFKITEPGLEKVFIGHTSTQFWNTDEPMKASIITNIDTGGGWYGKITVYNIDTDEFYQSDSARLLYPKFKGR